MKKGIEMNETVNGNKTIRENINGKLVISNVRREFMWNR